MSVAETILRKTLNNIIVELHYDGAEMNLKQLSSGGANFTSALYSVTISAPNKESLKMFAKVADIKEKLRGAMGFDILFKTEQFMYNELIKVFEEIQEKYNIGPDDRFVFPKFYGGISTNGEETVVLEDLVAAGYDCYSRFKSLDWEHAAAAVQSLAKFHALSFAYQKEDPENFSRNAEQLKYKQLDTMQKDDPNRIETWKRIVGAAIEVTRVEHKDRLIKFLTNEETSYEEFKKFRIPLNQTVFCHGDYRVSNMLFRREDGVVKAIVVDYQTVHTGSPTADLLYLVFTGTDEEFRKKYHEQLLDLYHSELSKALERLTIDVNEVYPREMFDSELKEMLGPALRMSAVLLPLVLVEAEQAPSAGQMESINDFALSPTQMFAERFSGIVSDCIRWECI